MSMLEILEKQEILNILMWKKIPKNANPFTFEKILPLPKKKKKM